MSLIRNGLFILYNAKISATNFGYTLYMITIPAFSYLVSGNIVFTGLTLFVEYGIYSMTFLVGPIVDRVEDKRIIIIVSEVVIAFCSIILGLVMEQGVFNRELFLSLVAAISIGWDFVWTADYYVLPLIVKQDELLKANGYSGAVGNAHVGAGLFFGGFFLVVLGAYGAILTYGASMALASIITAFIPLKVSKESRTLKPGFRSGWKYTLGKNRNLLILSVLILPLFGIFGTAPTLAITDIFAQKATVLYSLMFSMLYIGSMAIGILLGRLNPNRNLGAIIMAFYILFGVFLSAGVILQSNIAADALVWLLLGMFANGRYPIYSAYLQKVTEKEMLGRVASNMYTFRGITAAAGTLILPVLAGKFGSYEVFAASGIIVVVMSLIIVAAFRPLMKISI